MTAPRHQYQIRHAGDLSGLSARWCQRLLKYQVRLELWSSPHQ